MEKRELLAADLGLNAIADTAVPTLGTAATELAEVSKSDSAYDNGDWFVADSFSFGVEREMKESGEKRGTEDINIGVGELQECTISKSMDMASMQLSQFAINGNTAGQAEIDFVEVAGGGSASDTQPMGWDNTTHKKWSDSALQPDTTALDAAIESWVARGDADDRPTEEVAFYYNKIAAPSANATDGVVDAADYTVWRDNLGAA